MTETMGTTETNERRGPVRRLAGSSKALVVLAVSAASFAALWCGKATWGDVEGLLKWVLAPWLAAVGIEDAARHVRDGLQARQTPSNDAPSKKSGTPKETGTPSEHTIPVQESRVPVGRASALEAIRAIFAEASTGHHVRLTVKTKDDEREVAAFIAQDGNADGTSEATLEAALEEAEEHPGEIRHYALVDETSKRIATFSLGYT